MRKTTTCDTMIKASGMKNYSLLQEDMHVKLLKDLIGSYVDSVLMVHDTKSWRCASGSPSLTASRTRSHVNYMYRLADTRE